MGFVTLHKGDIEQAEEFFRSSLITLCEVGYKYPVATLLSDMSGPASARGESERAARLLGASEVQFETLGFRLQAGDQFEVDKYIAEAKNLLSEDAFAAAWSEGRAMSFDEAVAYALGEDIKSSL